jgi:hypothetical protein
MASRCGPGAPKLPSDAHVLLHSHRPRSSHHHVIPECLSTTSGNCLGPPSPGLLRAMAARRGPRRPGRARRRAPRGPGPISAGGRRQTRPPETARGRQPAAQAEVGTTTGAQAARGPLQPLSGRSCPLVALRLTLSLAWPTPTPPTVAPAPSPAGGSPLSSRWPRTWPWSRWMPYPVNDFDANGLRLTLAGPAARTDGRPRLKPTVGGSDSGGRSWSDRRHFSAPRADRSSHRRLSGCGHRPPHRDC